MTLKEKWDTKKEEIRKNKEEKRQQKQKAKEYKADEKKRRIEKVKKEKEEIKRRLKSYKGHAFWGLLLVSLVLFAVVMGYSLLSSLLVRLAYLYDVMGPSVSGLLLFLISIPFAFIVKNGFKEKVDRGILYKVYKNSRTVWFYLYAAVLIIFNLLMLIGSLFDNKEIFFVNFCCQTVEAIIAFEETIHFGVIYFYKYVLKDLYSGMLMIPMSSVISLILFCSLIPNFRWESCSRCKRSYISYITTTKEKAVIMPNLKKHQDIGAIAQRMYLPGLAAQP